jgi:HAE1 family hydrophobic/amphiphilic exporter-1
MNIWEICIRRPIFTLMLVAAPVVLGLAAYPQLGVDLFPERRFPGGRGHDDSQRGQR